MTNIATPFVSLSEAAELQGICTETVKKGIREQTHPGHKVGGRYTIPRPWFEAWLRGEPLATQCARCQQQAEGAVPNGRTHVG